MSRALGYDADAVVARGRALREAEVPLVSAAPRPTGEEAYTDGAGTFHPLERRIVPGTGIAGERVVRVDACVIGAGRRRRGRRPRSWPRAGMRVAMLEEGEWHDTPTSFTARPRDMTALLYRDAGQIATVGHAADRAAARPRGRRHDAGQLRHLLPHARRACSSCGASASASRS